MAAIETTTTRPLPMGALTVHRIVSFGGEIVARFQRWQDVRRTVRILSELDSDQLDDLGLTRGDIADFAHRGHF